MKFGGKRDLVPVLRRLEEVMETYSLLPEIIVRTLFDLLSEARGSYYLGIQGFVVVL